MLFHISRQVNLSGQNKQSILNTASEVSKTKRGYNIQPALILAQGLDSYSLQIMDKHIASGQYKYRPLVWVHGQSNMHCHIQLLYHPPS